MPASDGSRKRITVTAAGIQPLRHRLRRWTRDGSLVHLLLPAVTSVYSCLLYLRVLTRSVPNVANPWCTERG